jgi:hypothetical protein
VFDEDEEAQWKKDADAIDVFYSVARFFGMLQYIPIFTQQEKYSHMDPAKGKGPKSREQLAKEAADQALVEAAVEAESAEDDIPDYTTDPNYTVFDFTQWLAGDDESKNVIIIPPTPDEHRIGVKHWRRAPPDDVVFTKEGEVKKYPPKKKGTKARRFDSVYSIADKKALAGFHLSSGLWYYSVVCHRTIMDGVPLLMGTVVNLPCLPDKSDAPGTTMFVGVVYDDAHWYYVLHNPDLYVRTVLLDLFLHIISFTDCGRNVW